MTPTSWLLFVNVCGGIVDDIDHAKGSERCCGTSSAPHVWQGIEKTGSAVRSRALFFVDQEVHVMKRYRISTCHSEKLPGEVRSFLGLEKHARAPAKSFAPLLQ